MKLNKILVIFLCLFPATMTQTRYYSDYDFETAVDARNKSNPITRENLCSEFIKQLNKKEKKQFKDYLETKIARAYSDYNWRIPYLENHNAICKKIDDFCYANRYGIDTIFVLGGGVAMVGAVVAACAAGVVAVNSLFGDGEIARCLSKKLLSIKTSIDIPTVAKAAAATGALALIVNLLEKRYKQGYIVEATTKHLLEIARHEEVLALVDKSLQN